MRTSRLFTALVGLVLGACASAAKTAEQPGLGIPPPPPHVVPITPEPVIEPVSEIPAPTVPAGRGATRGPRDVPAKPATDAKPEGKSDAKPEAAPPADAPPAVAPVPPPPAPQLRTAESSGAETSVRATIDRARGLLNSVDYRRLTTARKKAYDDAKAFAQQADDALKAGNVMFAQGVAAKAETLAKDLAGR